MEALDNPTPHINDGERMELKNLYAIQQNAMRAEACNRAGMNRQLGSCWECGALDHYSHNCPKKRDRPEHLYLCYNCREEGHRASDFPKPVQVRINPQYTRDIPRDQTALNWSNKEVSLNTEEPTTSGSNRLWR